MNPGYRLGNNAKGFWYKCRLCGALCGRAGWPGDDIDKKYEMVVVDIEAVPGQYLMCGPQPLCKSCAKEYKRSKGRRRGK